MSEFINSLLEESGQGLTEYSVLLAILVIIVAAGLVMLGPKLLNLYVTTNDAIN
ncbi:MAG: Flp family type IVb pilin [Bacillota bacterium]